MGQGVLDLGQRHPEGLRACFRFRGGLSGFTATRFARLAGRYTATHPGFRIWHVACLLPPTLLFFAWIDPPQHRILQVGAVVAAGVCLLFGVASVSVHRHWTRVGRQGPADARDLPRVRRKPPWPWIFLLGGGLTTLIIGLLLPAFRVAPPGPRPWTASEHVSASAAPTTRVTPQYCGNGAQSSSDPDVALNASNGGEVATVYTNDLVEIDFANGQPMLSAPHLLCFAEVQGNSNDGGPITDGAIVYEARRPGLEVVDLDRADRSKSVLELSIVTAPLGSNGSALGILVRIAGILMLALGALGLVVGWWGALPPQSKLR